MNLRPTYKVLPSYDHLIEKGTDSRELIAKNGGLEVTIDTIKKAIKQYKPQVRKLAEHLKGNTHLQSDYNVWHWIKKDIKYSFDTPGKEEIRTPYASYRDGFIGKTLYRNPKSEPTGVDCEDYTILASSLLENMGYDPTPNIVAFNHKVNFQHIFPTDGQIILDDVMPDFNSLPRNITKSMKVELLNGIEESPIYGLGAIAKPDLVTKRLMNVQSALLQRIRNGNHTDQNLKDLRKLRFAILLNGSEERDELLKLLPIVDDITANGEYIFKQGVEFDTSEAEELEGLDEIGRLRLGKFFKKIGSSISKTVKKAAKGVGTFVKKRWQDLKKIALSIPRQGILLALKMNIGRMSSRMKYGYLTSEEARRKKLDPTEYARLKNKVEKNENLFASVGGNKDNFRSAVIKGGGGLAGLVHPKDLEPVSIEGVVAELEGFSGLGFAPVAAAGAAAPFVIKIVAALKDIDFKKLFSGSDVSEEEQQKLEEAIDTSSDGLKSALSEGFKDPEEQEAAKKALNENSEMTATTKYLMIGGIAVGVLGAGALVFSATGSKGKRR